MLHLTTDADTCHIVASMLIDKDPDDSSQIGRLSEWVAGSAAFLSGDVAYDQDNVYAGITARPPAVNVVVPSRSSAVSSHTAETAITHWDGLLCG